jgi:hypothetical protein
MRRTTARAVFAALALLLGGCQAKPANHPPSASGLWATDGYGYVFEIGPDTLKSYEVTKLSCLPSFTAAAAPAPSGAVGAFRMVNIPVTLVLLPDGEAPRGRVRIDGAASDILVQRIDKKPEVCDRATPNTPRSNFDVFVEAWAEHYPFFAEKNVDWPAVVAESRAKVTDNTTEEQLFSILVGLIAPLEDAHTGLSAESLKKQYQGSRKSPAWVEKSERDAAYALATHHLTGPLQSFCEGQIEFGMLEPDVGYLRIRSFYGYTKDGSFESGLTALEAALDTIFASPSSLRGLVIDVRWNGGGMDRYGLAIAARLTDKEYIAYAKQARNDPNDPTRWTREQPSVVKPTTRPGFKGRAVELIGIQSISAAETFTQALLNRTPTIVRVGENTQGVFSDVLRRKLPNGWEFGLPNERFVTNGRSYDGSGIAPDVAILSSTPERLKSGRDAGIEKALELLREGR